MRKIKLTQGKFALIDDEDYDWLNQWKWHATKEKHGVSYACRIVQKNKVIRMVIMHRLVAKTPVGLQTDHINHNGLDNRKKNLRSVTASENQLNRKGPQSNNTSGFIGVSWDQKSQKWRAEIKRNKKTTFVGHFPTKEDANRARLAALKMMYDKP